MKSGVGMNMPDSVSSVWPSSTTCCPSAAKGIWKAETRKESPNKAHKPHKHIEWRQHER